ncbi:polyribonucleotide nucleotidyltransferase [Cutibacterium acnes JCM 18916]|nr:polyribonucleotide nucleotidyltransferase [Cutibacterium acnes JCM 18916]
MMVEAESTPATWGLVRGGRTAPTEEVVATGLEAAKPFIKVLCDAQVALAAKLPKETYDFPVFKDYEDDVYAAVEEKAADELSRIEQIAAKLERQEAESELKARIKAELAETFPEREAEISGAFKAVMKKRSSASASLTRACESTVVDRVISAPCRLRSALFRGSTVQPCSSAARPRFWACRLSTCSIWSKSLTPSPRKTPGVHAQLQHAAVLHR